MIRTIGLCLFVVCALMVVACAARRFGVDTYGRSLKLEMALDRESARPGDDLLARQVLRNDGEFTVEGCLGESKGYNMVGTKDARGLVNVVDHPGCVKRFILNPGQALEWSEPISVIDVGVGPARANVWVQVTDPTECDQYGCDAITVKSTLVPFVIVPVLLAGLCAGPVGARSRALRHTSNQQSHL